MVIVACEYSGIVRDAFLAKGIQAISCDIIETEWSGPHIKDDIRNVDLSKYELMIAHPPCTYLCVSGAKHFGYKRDKQKQALQFVKYLMNAPCKHICIENPISIISTKIRKPDQIIQPWQFGHGEVKSTCLWLKNLPKLQYTNIVNGRDNRIHTMQPGLNRGKERARTYSGIAKAMAEQWGNLIQSNSEDRNAIN